MANTLTLSYNLVYCLRLNKDFLFILKIIFLMFLELCLWLQLTEMKLAKLAITDLLLLMLPKFIWNIQLLKWSWLILLSLQSLLLHLLKLLLLLLLHLQLLLRLQSYLVEQV